MRTRRQRVPGQLNRQTADGKRCLVREHRVCGADRRCGSGQVREGKGLDDMKCDIIDFLRVDCDAGGSVTTRRISTGADSAAILTWSSRAFWSTGSLFAAVAAVMRLISATVSAGRDQIRDGEGLETGRLGRNSRHRQRSRAVRGRQAVRLGRERPQGSRGIFAQYIGILASYAG